ncbi:MAG: hypothetical protein Q8P18_27695 [Pseudomonadota bacterium]|nr:hypothetical protein [Pseudomonadota bacterium]
MLLLLALARPADACSFDSPGSFELDPASDDTVAPSPPGELLSVRVVRGRGPECHDGGMSSSTSCDDLGTLSVGFVAALDDRSPAVDTGAVQTGVGYRVRVAEGALPDGLSIDPDHDHAAFRGDGTASLFFVWIDDASDDQDAFAATLAVTAIDLAGNESAEALFEVSDPGTVDADGEPGCPEEEEAEASALCGTSAGAGLVAMLVGAGLVARRRFGRSGG